MKIQVNIQNELTSSSSQTRSKKHKEIQTESETNFEINESKNSDSNHKVKRLLEKRANLMESAIFENNSTLAFLSKSKKKIFFDIFPKIILKLNLNLKEYDVDWYGGSATTTNPFTLVNQQLLKEEEV